MVINYLTYNEFPKLLKRTWKLYKNQALHLAAVHSVVLILTVFPNLFQYGNIITSYLFPYLIAGHLFLIHRMRVENKFNYGDLFIGFVDPQIKSKLYVPVFLNILSAFFTLIITNKIYLINISPQSPLFDLLYVSSFILKFVALFVLIPMSLFLNSNTFQSIASFIKQLRINYFALILGAICGAILLKYSYEWYLPSLILGPFLLIFWYHLLFNIYHIREEYYFNKISLIESESNNQNKSSEIEQIEIAAQPENDESFELPSHVDIGTVTNMPQPSKINISPTERPIPVTNSKEQTQFTIGENTKTSSTKVQPFYSVNPEETNWGPKTEIIKNDPQSIGYNEKTIIVPQEFDQNDKTIIEDSSEEDDPLEKTMLITDKKSES